MAAYSAKDSVHGYLAHKSNKEEEEDAHLLEHRVLLFGVDHLTPPINRTAISKERLFIELMKSDRKLKASRVGSE